MNEYDSNRIVDTVKKIGFSKTSYQSDADCYLINILFTINEVIF